MKPKARYPQKGVKGLGFEYRVQVVFRFHSDTEQAPPAARYLTAPTRSAEALGPQNNFRAQSRPNQGLGFRGLGPKPKL